MPKMKAMVTVPHSQIAAISSELPRLIGGVIHLVLLLYQQNQATEKQKDICHPSKYQLFDTDKAAHQDTCDQSGEHKHAHFQCFIVDVSAQVWG